MYRLLSCLIIWSESSSNPPHYTTTCRAVLGAASAGGLTAVCVSSDTLPNFIPAMSQIAGQRLPVVFHADTFAVDKAMVLRADHSSVLAVRNTGFVVISSHSVQVR